MSTNSKRRTVGTLIDGYNLMFQSIGAPDPRRGPLALREARQHCLDYIASRMSDSERQRTWIVFDSQTDRDLPTELTYRGICVTFSRDHASADELIIEAIRTHPTPKKLSVVSSDHQIQRAARGRGAIVIESDDWKVLGLDPLDDEERLSDSDGSREDPPKAAERDRPIDSQELKEWLERFGYT